MPRTRFRIAANNVNGAPIRHRPYQYEDILWRQPNGDVVDIIGYGTNAHGNLWYRMLGVEGDEFWVFSGNIERIQ